MMKKCLGCGEEFNGAPTQDECPPCRAKERDSDMAVGDKGG